MSTERERLIAWLLDNGGPVVRYRTAAELLDDRAGIDMGLLTRDLLGSRHVRLWFERLGQVRVFHHSANHAFENVMGKLLEFGVRAGMEPLDRGVARFRQWMATAMDGPPGIMRTLNASIVAAGLGRAGYEDEALQAFLQARLDGLCRVIREYGCDIYADAREYGDIPKAFLGSPLVRPEVTPEGEFTLPCIHDLYAFSALPAGMGDADTRRKVNTVVKYILSDAYQALPDGYGVLRAGKRRYYAMGWTIHLPGFHGFDFGDYQAGYFAQRVELAARFPVARKHGWFRECMAHLHGFQTAKGTWRLPRRYLKEQSTGYWVMGAHMGLEDIRRTKGAIEIESTFRILKMMKPAGGEAT